FTGDFVQDWVDLFANEFVRTQPGMPFPGPAAVPKQALEPECPAEAEPAGVKPAGDRPSQVSPMTDIPPDADEDERERADDQGAPQPLGPHPERDDEKDQRRDLQFRQD